jgi:predicted nuclease of restriction endonuclease-like (RecB) superfamily
MGDPIPHLSDKDLADYQTLLTDLKSRVRSAQVRAATSANRELILLYWEIGRAILSAQAREGWGAKVVDRLAADLRREFPEMRGFSPRNLKYMRRLAEAWPDRAIVQQAVAQIPWGHNCVLLDKLDDPELREYYVGKTIEHRWSRDVLALQIASRLHEREGAAVTNFAATLPAPQSDLARQVVKDPYVFDFLSLGPEASEREVHQSLLANVRDFLLELGTGFALLGSEYRLEVGGQEYYLDLLFYHARLHCYVVVELKVGAFVPEHSGKLNFYLSAVDDLLRNAAVDQPSIGILLCREANRVIAEYALRDMTKPMAVSTYMTRALPGPMREALPAVEEIERKVVSATLRGVYNICGPESEPRQDDGDEGVE